jgi:RNA-binding protein NOB1
VADLGVKDDDALLNHEDDQVREPLDVALERLPTEDHETIEDPALPESEATSDTLYDDPDDEDDGEGEWITPSNVAVHKSRALDLLPAASNSKKTAPVKQLGAACMTADFAMQNVILQMGLKLVGVEGKRIERVKTWVLRCHACFK